MTNAKTFRSNITLMVGGKYVPPGTEVTLPEDEAKRLIEMHGEYAGPATDPKLAAADALSVETLNRNHAANDAPEVARLLESARRRGVKVTPGMSARDIAVAIEAAA